MHGATITRRNNKPLIRRKSLQIKGLLQLPG